MMRATLIPEDHVVRMWPRVLPFMERAAEYTYGRYDANDILDSIVQYNHHLWVAFTASGEVKGAVVTVFKQYPKKKCLDLTFVGGDDGLEWKAPMLRMLQHWARDNECEGIESSGRLGWGRALKDDGYKFLWQTYELPVADTGLGALHG